MSSRRTWLDLRCPACGAAPSRRCCRWRSKLRGRSQAVPLPRLHVARGWRERPCPTCKSDAGSGCVTPSGRPASKIHVARLRPAGHELLAAAHVWDELAQRGATAAAVPFWGRTGHGGETGRVRLTRIVDDALEDVEVWSGRDELCWALEAPVWERYGCFAGQPLIRGEVLWLLDRRAIVLNGTRNGVRFQETVT